MFERFTQQARRVVVLAQEERAFSTTTTSGTEHLMLGLIADQEGKAARVLRDLDRAGGARQRWSRSSAEVKGLPRDTYV